MRKLIWTLIVVAVLFIGCALHLVRPSLRIIWFLACLLAYVLYLRHRDPEGWKWFKGAGTRVARVVKIILVLLFGMVLYYGLLMGGGEYIIESGSPLAKMALYVYALGVAVAALLQVSRLIARGCVFFSARAQNLRTAAYMLGLYWDPWNRQYTAEPTDARYCREVLGIEQRTADRVWAVVVFLTAPSLSWLWVVVALSRWLFNRTPLPERVKEFRFKMSVRLSIFNWERLLALVGEYSDVAFPAVPREQIGQMVLDAKRESATSSLQAEAVGSRDR